MRRDIAQVVYFIIPVINHPDNNKYWQDLYYHVKSITGIDIKPWDGELIRPEAACLEFATIALVVIKAPHKVRDHLVSIQKIAATMIERT